jgi:hypothetical protein
MEDPNRAGDNHGHKHHHRELYHYQYPKLWNGISHKISATTKIEVFTTPKSWKTVCFIKA